MKKRFLKQVAVAALLAPAMAAPAAAQGDEDAAKKDKWDVAAPPMPTREIPIDVEEGTWMNVDVSPDGRTIAFDLLGDIYTMPIGGGAATRIAEGLPFEMQPQFSSDGKRIAFTSDRGGGDNIWIMNADGSDKRQVTKETFRLLNQPTWSEDGRFIAARKHFTTSRSLGAGEIWLYHVSGGDGVQLVKRASEQLQKELGEPAFAPGGEAVYYVRNTSPGNTFQYAQDSNQSLFAIEKYDMASGETSTVVSGPGGAVRPSPSPDGKKLAFVRRDRGVSTLYVADLQSGATKKLYAPLDRDMQETWAVHGVYPAMDWTPDSKSIVFWAGGKIRRVDLKGAASVIPFSVNDTRDVVDPPRPQVDVAPDTVRATMPRFAAVSPNGRSVVFEAFGKLWTKALPNGAPRRLTGSGDSAFELFPAWSRDSGKIVYVEWDDDNLGRIRTVSASGGGGRTITQQTGHYRRPQFSPDGRTIVFEKGAGAYLLAPEWSVDAGVYHMPSGGGAMTKLADSGMGPHFGAANDRVFMTVQDGANRNLVSVGLSGEETRTHAASDMIADYAVSPDGEFVAFRENYAAYVMPLAPGPQSVSAGKKASALPVTRASDGGATYLSWSGNGLRLNWSLGPTLYSAATADMFKAAPESGDSEDKPDGFEPPADGVSLLVTQPAAKPSGRVAITGARIITMADENGGVIENGTIVVNGNRIDAVGPAGEVSIPGGARVVDAAGKTIVPGYIDAHAHGPLGEDDIIPQRNWSAIAHLALGVTTIHDPSNTASEVFPAANLQQTGKILAPRLFSTAEVVYGAKAPGFFADIGDYDDALDHVRRLKLQGAHSIKNYNQPRRDQRQQVVAASLAENIAVVAEGASLFTQDITLIADGNTSLEHNIPQQALYEDVLSFYGQTKVGYTPTLVVTYSGLAGDPYWRYATDVWKHPILSAHTPPHVLQANSVRSTKAPDEDFADQYAAREAKKLMDRGVYVSIGAHGQQQGLASHWEMWSFARGGMSPLDALKTATVNPARHLGFDRDIGTLEAGKLADLVILSANPLDDIQNTDDIEHIMQNGRLFEAATMDEVVTGNAALPAYWWE